MPGKTLRRSLIAVLLLQIISICVRTQDRRTVTANLFINNRSTNQDRPIGILPIALGHTPFRTYNGTNNNINTRQSLEFGAANIPLFREMPAAYSAADPFNAMAGENRPNPRATSNLVINEPITHFNSRGLSTFVYVWGQFIDHDMSNTPTDTIEYVPIPLPPDETIFNQPIPFFRSKVWPGSGKTYPRQQINLITSWIDGSMVYGSDSIRARWLRTFRNGKMKTSTGNFLPFNTVTGEEADAIDPNAPTMANDSGHTVKTFVAGDVRAAEHPGIAGMHTIFVREHNRICDRLVALGLRGDELIYQMARKEVGALIQAITYQEWLPAVGVTMDPYTGYHSFIRPDIMNNFATAAFRVGHSMVADDIFLRDNNCQEVPPGELSLVDVFWNPDILLKFGLEPFLKGFAAHTQYETDTRINDVLRNFLFNNADPADPTRFGIDLGSLNIQRGRDHGLPDYNTVRMFYTGKKANSFYDISSDSTFADSLKTLYGTVDQIDLWIGVLAEDHIPNASLGKTMNAIFKTQFENLRDGDFYFYLHDPFLLPGVRDKLIKTKFSDVIKRNTTLTSLQSNVFFSLACPGETAENGAEADTTTIAASIINKSDLVLSPNPATSFVRIDVGEMEGPLMVKIYNTSIALVGSSMVSMKSSNFEVNVSALPAGTYIMNISNGKDMKTSIFVKL